MKENQNQPNFIPIETIFFTAIKAVEQTGDIGAYMYVGRELTRYNRWLAIQSQMDKSDSLESPKQED